MKFPQFQTPTLVPYKRWRKGYFPPSDIVWFQFNGNMVVYLAKNRKVKVKTKVKLIFCFNIYHLSYRICLQQNSYLPVFCIKSVNFRCKDAVALFSKLNIINQSQVPPPDNRASYILCVQNYKKPMHLKWTLGGSPFLYIFILYKAKNTILNPKIPLIMVKR